MKLPALQRAGPEYSAPHFESRVKWLVREAEHHADVLLHRGKTSLFEAVRKRRGTVHRWEQSMLCRAKEELYNQRPHIYDARFRTLRERIDSFPVMQHFNLVRKVS